MARADVKVSILDTPTFRAVIGRLGEIAAHDCIYVRGDCPQEWPGEQHKWCGACLAEEVLRAAQD